jgi:hypothetical protein
VGIEHNERGERKERELKESGNKKIRGLVRCTSSNDTGAERVCVKVFVLRVGLEKQLDCLVKVACEKRERE